MAKIRKQVRSVAKELHGSTALMSTDTPNEDGAEVRLYWVQGTMYHYETSAKRSTVFKGIPDMKLVMNSQQVKWSQLPVAVRAHYVEHLFNDKLNEEEEKKLIYA